VRDYVEWHEAYDDPISSLSRRLRVVQHRLHETLDALEPGPLRVLSLCAGEGRDVILVLANHRRGHETSAVLIELDPTLAARAVAAASEAGLERLEVRCVGAGRSDGYIDVVPVDVLLLCGIFGNIGDHDVKTTIAAASGMVRSGGYVLWTRGGSDPDMRPAIRRWFVEAGMPEIAFEGHPEVYGVGVNRVTQRSPAPIDAQLFTFTR
jgi:hypothetical protein